MADHKSPTTGELHNRKAGFWTRKKKICAAGVLIFIVLFLVIFLPILFFVIVPKTAQKNINSSVLTFENAAITNPTNSSFDLAMRVAVTDAGHTKATLTHTTPMSVAWIYNGQDIPILEMDLPPFTVDGGNGMIDTTVTGVRIVSVPALTKFNMYMISQRSFQWRLKSGISAHALGRDYGGLTLEKVVTLAGMGGLQGTTIAKYQVLGPVNGTSVPLSMEAVLINPSPVGLTLDVTVFNVTSGLDGQSIGTATSQKVQIAGNGNTTLILAASLNQLSTINPATANGLQTTLGNMTRMPLGVSPMSVGAPNPVAFIAGALVGAHLNATLGANLGAPLLHA